MRAVAVSERFKNLGKTKQQKILEAAVDEFAQHGFMQASMNRIVRKIGIAKGSLFQYFGNKEGLFSFIFDYAVDLVRQSLRRVKQDTAHEDFFTRVRSSLLAGVQFIDNHPHVYQIYLKMIFQERFPYRAEFLQKVHLFSADYLEPLVTTGIERGELKADLDLSSTVFFLDALMDRFLQAYSVSFLDAGSQIYRAPREEIEKRADELMTLLRGGLANEDQSG